MNCSSAGSFPCGDQEQQAQLKEPGLQREKPLLIPRRAAGDWLLPGIPQSFRFRLRCTDAGDAFSLLELSPSRPKKNGVGFSVESRDHCGLRFFSSTTCTWHMPLWGCCSRLPFAAGLSR